MVCQFVANNGSGPCVALCGLQIYGDGGLPFPARENATQGAQRDFRAVITENTEKPPLKNTRFQPLFSAFKKRKIPGEMPGESSLAVSGH